LSYNHLQFICCSIIIFSSNRVHEQVFEDSWCTWDPEASDLLCMMASEALN
jgi:hypothetical protein